MGEDNTQLVRVISAKCRIGAFVSEIGLLKIPVGMHSKEVEVKKRLTINIDKDSKKYLS